MDQNDTRYARWLSGELSPDEIKAMKSSGEWEELAAIIKATNALNIPKMDVDKAYKEIVAKRHQRNPAVRKFPLVRIASMAAAMLLLVILYFVINNRNKRISAQLAHTATYEFSDQSKVVLNDGSNIEFDEKNWASNRVLTLTGEAYFDVASGPSFTVQTDNGLVRVLGTQFNVRAWGQRLYVECYSGKVTVEYVDQEKTLTARQAILMDKGQLGELLDINHEKPIWQSGFSKFTAEDVKAVFAELERQYDIKVDYPSSLNREFSGNFPHNDLERAIKNICDPLNIGFTISTNQKTIVIDANN